MNFASATLAGRVTRDPESGTTKSGKSYCHFGLAVNSNFKGADGEKVTHFFDITMWGKTAETASQYVRKGTLILVSGRLEQQTWTDKATGGNRSKVVVVANEFQLGPKNSGVGGDLGVPSSRGREDRRESRAVADPFAARAAAAFAGSSMDDLQDDEIPF